MAELEKDRTIFVARQPIFDCNKNIFGYELLFRHGLENFFDAAHFDKDYASSKVLLDSVTVFDLKDLTRGKRAFLNFTARVLLSDLISAFSTDSIVIELLEDIPPYPPIVEACKKIKNQGYLIALDDFEYNPTYQPLINLADIIKVDFLATLGEERRNIIEKSGNKKIKFLAEKVETIEDYNQGLEMGYAYFQGYYFSKPIIVAGKDVPSIKVNLMQIFKEMQQPEINMDKLEKILERDLSLSFKLLRFINSAAFGMMTEIRSIRHALNMLGIIELKKWMTMILLSQLGSDKPDELMINSLIRAKFCELTAETIGQKSKKSDFFLMGLFSLIDAFLDRPISDILSDLPIPTEVKSAIMDQKGKMGETLSLIACYERSKWDNISQISRSLNIDEKSVLEHYFTSIRWANDFSIEQ